MRGFITIHFILQHAQQNAISGVANEGATVFLLTILSPKTVPKILVESIAMSFFKEGIDFSLVGHVIVSW